MSANLSDWAEALSRELTRGILPFWLSFLGDGKSFPGRIDGLGVAHPEAEKGAVLIARMLWTFSAAYRMTGFEEYLTAARKTEAYLSDYFIDPRFGGVYWAVSADGFAVSDKKQSYALGFAIYGLSEYVAVSGDVSALDKAKALFEALEAHAWDEQRGGYVEALSRDWQPLTDMRLSEKDKNTSFSMNTHLHLLESYTNLLRVWPDPKVAGCVQRLIRIHTDRLFDPETGHLNLFFNAGWQPQGRVVSYGHDIEASWLINEAVSVLGDPKTVSHVAPVVETLARAACEGLRPDGSLIYESNPITLYVDAERHWWVQAEAAVGFVNMYQRTGAGEFLLRSFNAWEYIRTHLIDHKTGEWFWSIREDGTSNLCDDKAGLWKCPYHNGRMCMELITRIEKLNL